MATTALFRSMAVLWAMCGCLAGQPDSSTARPRSIRKDQPIIDLASAAAVLPPELAADGLIQLAHSEAPSDKKLAVAWLEDAFRLAKQATFPYRVVTLSGIAATSDSTAGIVQLSLEPGLDALSLRSRSIREMLRFDRQKAREMFDVISSNISRAFCRSNRNISRMERLRSESASRPGSSESCTIPAVESEVAAMPDSVTTR